MPLVIDGSMPTGELSHDGALAPFRIFDDNLQDWIGPAYDTREDAERALRELFHYDD